MYTAFHTIKQRGIAYTHVICTTTRVLQTPKLARSYITLH